MQEFRTVQELLTAFPTQKSCKIYLGKLFFKNHKEMYCPHCGSTDKIYRFKDKITYKCSLCKLKFSSTTGTIFQNSKVPLPKWMLAIYYLTYHKKGISSTQLAKDIGVTQKTAWHMGHRIRQGMAKKIWERKLEKIVQVDEGYFGGLESNKRFDKRTPYNQGRSLKTKFGVFAMMEPHGEVRAFTVNDVTEGALIPLMVKHIDPNATVYSDEWKAYNHVGDYFKQHIKVDHGIKQWVGDNGATTNAVENFWRHFRATTLKTYHRPSKKHFDKYVQEFVFRYNHRKKSSFDLINLFLIQSIGRLSYQDLKNK